MGYLEGRRNRPSRLYTGMNEITSSLSVRMATALYCSYPRERKYGGKDFITYTCHAGYVLLWDMQHWAICRSAYISLGEADKLVPGRIRITFAG